jgi:hypothetical protein
MASAFVPLRLTAAELGAAIAASLERPVCTAPPWWPVSIPGRRWTGRQWVFCWGIHVSEGVTVFGSVPVSAS